MRMELTCYLLLACHHMQMMLLSLWSKHVPFYITQQTEDYYFHHYDISSHGVPAACAHCPTVCGAKLVEG